MARDGCPRRLAVGGRFGAQSHRPLSRAAATELGRSSRPKPQAYGRSLWGRTRRRRHRHRPIRCSPVRRR